MSTLLQSQQKEIQPYSIPNPSFNQSQITNTKLINPYDSNEMKASTMSKYGNNMNNSNYNKFSKTTGKQKKIGGRDEKIEPDLYYKVKDENEQLKLKKIEMNDRIKKLEVELANLKSGLIKERKLGDRRVIKMNGGYDKDLETCKLENDKLKDDNQKLRIYIQGLQSDNKMLFGNKKGKKTTARNPLQAQKEKNDMYALIAHLRASLKEAQEDRKNLIAELTNIQNQKNTPLTSSQRQLKGTNSTFYNADNKTNYERNSLQLDTNNKILELTKQSLNEYIEKYEKERDKTAQLESKISILQSDLDKLQEYQALIEDYKKREKILEQRVQDLCENPFIQQAEERGNIYRKFQENERALTEAEKKLRQYEEQIRNYERENKQLKTNLDSTLAEKDRYKEETMRLKISNEEKEKNSKAFQDQINLIGQYGEVDSNFGKMIGMLRMQNDNENWRNINFLNQMSPEQSKDPVFLNKEIERLKIEKGVLGNELEKTKSLLTIQQQINDDMKLVQDCDQKKYNSEVKQLKQKIDELCKLIDIERLPKEYLVKDPNSNKPVLRDTTSLLNDLIPAGQKDPKYLNDVITEFSKDESEPDFSMNENAVDIYFGECEFEDGLEPQVGFKVENIMSFISVDFFIHQTQTSSIVSGKTPMYNLQLTFRVNVDEHLLNYLESDYINIEVYYLRDNVQSILGKGKIPLVELINIESNNKTNSRVINNVCSIYYIQEPSLKIASIHYKMRMRSPISEVLKWYHEQNKYIREINPVQNVLVENATKTMTTYSPVGGKVYEVKILITKAVDLIVSGPPRKILPYFYYKFYKEYERYSSVAQGNSPQFEDVSSFTVLYDPSLHDYIEKDNLNVYLFDSSDPIEVDISNKDQVKLVDSQNVQDLIGVSRIPLKGLLINDLIQGSFPVLNVNNKQVGELVVNIFWEEIMKNNSTVNSNMNINMNVGASTMKSQ